MDESVGMHETFRNIDGSWRAYVIRFLSERHRYFKAILSPFTDEEVHLVMIMLVGFNMRNFTPLSIFRIANQNVILCPFNQIIAHI